MSIRHLHHPTSNFISFIFGLPFDIILMNDKPLLRHYHIHRSRTTVNELITSYYHTIPEPEPQIIPLLSPTGFQRHCTSEGGSKCKIYIVKTSRWRDGLANGKLPRVSYRKHTKLVHHKSTLSLTEGKVSKLNRENKRVVSEIVHLHFLSCKIP